MQEIIGFECVNFDTFSPQGLLGIGHREFSLGSVPSEEITSSPPEYASGVYGRPTHVNTEVRQPQIFATELGLEPVTTPSQAERPPN